LSAFDLDEAALVKKPKPLGWFAAGLVAIVALGFAAAYYLPLNEAHSALLEKHEALAKKSNELDQALRARGKDLTTATQRKDELERFLKQGQDAEAKLKSQFEIVKATAERQLAAYVKAKLAHIESAASELTIGFSERAAFAPHTERMIPQVQSQICKAMESVGQGKDFKTIVETRVPEDEKDAWALAAKRVAVAADLLTTRCKVERERVSAQAVLVAAGTTGDALVLRVAPKASPLLAASQAPHDASGPAP